jgi:hypothetical protein
VVVESGRYNVATMESLPEGAEDSNRTSWVVNAGVCATSDRTNATKYSSMCSRIRHSKKKQFLQLFSSTETGSGGKQL